MFKKIVALAVLSLLPSVGGAADIAEILEGLLNPQLVAGAAYAKDAPLDGSSRYSVLLTANLLGPKVPPLPCYLGGLGVDLRTLNPAFQDISHAGWSLPYVTCAPWGEQVVLQVGQSSAFSDAPNQSGTSYYFGVGVGWASPNTLASKRVQRAAAKKQKALLKLQEEAQGTATAP